MAIVVRLIGVLMMLTALAVGVSHAPDRPVETLVARWAPPPSDFREINGQLVHLRDVGPREDATPIVLLHGVGSSLHTWQGWVDVLSRRRRVITLDLPGFGLTGPYAGRYASDDYRPETTAGFVLDVLDAMSVERFAIGGHSLGGEVAWQVALRAPQRVRKLVLVDATGYDVRPLEVPPAFLAARMPIIGRLGDWLTPRSMVRATLESLYGDPARVDEALVDRCFELGLRSGNRRAFRLVVQALRPGADAARIRQLRVPTLLIWGGRDRLVPPAAGERFRQDIPGSRLEVFATLGHVPHEEDPAATVVPVQAFLDAPP